MKKIFVFISLIFICSCSNCSPVKDNSEYKRNIEICTQKAINDIQNIKNIALDSAKYAIDSMRVEAVSKTDTTINKALQNARSAIEKDITDKLKPYSEEQEKLKSQIAYMENLLIIFASVFILMILGICIYLFKNRRKHDEELNEFVKNIILKSSQVEDYMNGFFNASAQQLVDRIQLKIDSNVEACLQKKKIQKIIIDNINNSQDRMQERKNINYTPRDDMREQSKNNISSESILYARNSNTMYLSNIESSYQRGKSIYKLILSDNNSQTAKIDLCIDREGVTQLIVGNDNKLLEPICIVTRKNEKCTKVIVNSPGIAEKDGDRWKVTQKVNVDLI